MIKKHQLWRLGCPLSSFNPDRLRNELCWRQLLGIAKSFHTPNDDNVGIAMPKNTIFYGLYTHLWWWQGDGLWHCYTHIRNVGHQVQVRFDLWIFLGLKEYGKRRFHAHGWPTLTRIHGEISLLNTAVHVCWKLEHLSYSLISPNVQGVKIPWNDTQIINQQG